MRRNLSGKTQPGRYEMRVAVTGQKSRLKEQHAGVPDRRHAAQKRQQHFADHWLDPKQQCRAEEQRCREKSGHTVCRLIRRGQGMMTLLADPKLAVVIKASCAFSSGNRWVTIAAKGNRLVRSSPSAALR